MSDPTIADRMAEYGVTMSEPQEMQRRDPGGSLWWCFLHKDGYDPEGWRREIHSETTPTLVDVVDELIEIEEVLSEGGGDGDFIGYLRQFSASDSRWAFTEIEDFYRDFTRSLESIKEAREFFGALPWFDLTENTERPSRD